MSYIDLKGAELVLVRVQLLGGEGNAWQWVAYLYPDGVSLGTVVRPFAFVAMTKEDAAPLWNEIDQLGWKVFEATADEAEKAAIAHLTQNTAVDSKSEIHVYVNGALKDQ